MVRVLVLTMLLLTSLVLNWVQHATIMRYRNALVERGRMQSLIVGSQVPPLQGAALDGTARTLRYGPDAEGKSTIIYYFSPDCGWCKRNTPNVNALYSELAATHRFIGVAASSPESVRSFLQEQDHRFDVIVNVDPESLKAYRFSGTPQTIRVAADGQVSAVWPGAYLGKVQDEIERALGIALPGLAAHD